MSGNPLEGRREPGAMLGRQQGSKRSVAARRWDVENQPTGYRLDPAVPARVREIQVWYRERGYQVTQSQIVESLLFFAFGAWERGAVSVDVVQMEPEALAVKRE